MPASSEVSRRHFLRLAGAAGISVAAVPASGSFLAACARSEGNPDTIKVGVMAPFSGQGQSIGIAVENSLQAAAREVNAGRGVEGRKVELLLRDTKDDLETTTRVYRQLAATEDLLGILWCGSMGFAETLPEIRRDRIPLVTVFQDPFSAGQLYPAGREASRSMFQMSVPDIFVKETLADYARNDRGYSSAAMLYDATLDGTYDLAGLSRRNFDQAFRAAAMTVGPMETFQPEEGFRPQLDRLKAAAPQVLYLDALVDDTVLIATALDFMGAGYIDTPTAKGTEWRPHVFGSLRGINGVWADQAGDAARTGSVSAWHLGGLPMLPSFAVGSWMRKLGQEPTGGEELPADALAALLNGLRRGGSTDRARMIAGMETMGPVKFASLPFTFSAEEHYAPKRDEIAVVTVERLRGAVATTPQYFLGTEWLEDGTYGSGTAGAATTLLVRPTLESNRRAHPELMEEILERGLGTQCTRRESEDGDITLTEECKVH